MAGGGSFFREFARSPKKVGAVLPSSRFLAEEIVACADIQPGHVVVEIGAGSGAITRVLQAAHPDNPMLAVEMSPEMVALLRREVPDCQVVEGMAQDLPRIVREWGYDRVDRIVSGLPWAAWPDEIQDPIFQGLHDVLADDGRMVTFAYLVAHLSPNARRLKRKLDHYFEAVSKSRTIMANVPPAFVYICDGPRKS